jgi:pimeloyl-ACP methyl ester carboxylesterase
MDMRGHGDSAWAPSPPAYNMDHLIRDSRAIVSAIGERPVALGASVGGMSALLSEGEMPGQYRAMVLVDIAPRLEKEGVDKISAFMRTGVEGFPDLGAAGEAIARYSTHRRRASNLDGLKKNLRLRDDGRWYWHWDPQFIAAEAREPDRGISEERARRACGHVRVPILLVRGGQSDIVSEGGARELLELVPTARTLDIAHAGHMVVGDDNDVFAGEVESFLDELDV